MFLIINRHFGLLTVLFIQAQATLFHYKSKNTKFTDYQETITLLDHCIKCAQANKSADLHPRLAKIQLLMADVYHLAEDYAMEAEHLNIAMDYFKRDS